MSRHLVLFETSGNQDFLFRTSMRRESVGASELIYQAGTRFVLQAHSATKSLWSDDASPFAMRAALAAQTPIEQGGEVEVVYATSGKALLITADGAIARSIVREATTTALREAPGLDLTGACIALDGFDDLGRSDESTLEKFSATIDRLHHTLARVQAARPSVSARFPLLPIVTPCRSSGLPARLHLNPATLSGGDTNEREVPVSSVCANKWRARKAWNTRVERICEEFEFEQFADEDPDDWIAVVHADGNGLGQVFRKFSNYLPRELRSPRGYLSSLRQFSAGIEAATEVAFRRACSSVFTGRGKSGNKIRVPVLPLVLGGDDLTLICAGDTALALIQAYLREFEEATAKSDDLRRILDQRSDTDRPPSGGLQACAGVAIVKPHFPFHAAYDLAEQLLRSAKTAKKHRCSGLDFHILYDSTFSDLGLVRDRLRLDNDDGKTHLTAKPYVVQPADAPVRADDEWVRDHDLEGLKSRVAALSAEDDGRRVLPRSQMHDLNAGLFLGHAAADARLSLVRERLDKTQLARLLEGEKTLFRTRTDAKNGSLEGERETRFLDALEVCGFWDAKG